MSANTTSTRKVRFNGDDKSSRASTVGGSSTSSSYSGSYPDQYTDPRFNLVALQDTLNKTVQELDDWREHAHRYKEDASSAKARVSALENSVSTLKNDKKDIERQVKELKQQLSLLQDDNDKLKKKNDSLKKKLRDQQDSQSDAPSSPDSAHAKLRRTGSKKSKYPDTDELDKDRLKERFDRSSPPSSTTSGSTHSKPPSSSKAPPSSSRHRRPSMNSERPSPLYVEPYGSGAPRAMPTSPVAPTSSRRTTSQPDYHISSAMQDPVSQYSSRAVGMQRGTVEVPLYEDGNYHFHPLPDQRRPY